MPKVVVLFNLKQGVKAEDYEQWARNSDIPTVRALASVDHFSTHRAIRLLVGDEQPPYRYVEIIDINDMGQFAEDLATPVMQQLAAAFQEFADRPSFILTEAL